jgi:hypothetical protein
MFWFYDESTEALFNTATVYFTIQNLTYTFNGSTANGSYALNASLGDYSVTYWSFDNSARTMPFTVAATPQNLTLYLVNSSSNILAHIYNADGLAAQDIYLRTYRLLSTGYTLVEVSLSNYKGEADFYGFLYTPRYYWVLTDLNGTVLKTTTETEIYATEIDFFLSSGSSIGDSWSKRGELSYIGPYFDNITNTWSLSYSDPTLTLTNITMIVTDATGTVKATDTSTATSDTLTINMDGLYSNGTTYFATVYVGYSPAYMLDTASYTYPEPNRPSFGAFGYFIMFLVLLLMGLVSFWNPAVSMILIAVTLFLGRIIQFHTIEWTYTIGLMALCFVVAWLVRDRA